MNTNNLNLKTPIKVMVKSDPILQSITCRCGTLLDHWKKFSYVKIQKCVVIGCSNIDLIGCPVTKFNSKDKGIYIIPFCKEHSKSTEELKILPSCPFVSADLTITCGEAVTVVTKYVEI